MTVELIPITDTNVAADGRVVGFAALELASK